MYFQILINCIFLRTILLRVKSEFPLNQNVFYGILLKNRLSLVKRLKSKIFFVKKRVSMCEKTTIIYFNSNNTRLIFVKRWLFKRFCFHVSGDCRRIKRSTHVTDTRFVKIETKTCKQYIWKRCVSSVCKQCSSEMNFCKSLGCFSYINRTEYLAISAFTAFLDNKISYKKGVDCRALRI